MIVRAVQLGIPVVVLVLVPAGVARPLDPGASETFVTEQGPVASNDQAAPLPVEADQSLVEAPCYGRCCGPLERWLAAEPWTLPQPCLLKNLGIHVGGWVEAGITGNTTGSENPYNATVIANDRHRDIEMNQLWLHFERPIDTSKKGWDIGGRLDVAYGSDWRIAAVHSHGLEGKINSEDQLYGLGIPQLYMEAGVGKLSVKIGHMADILGYEVVAPMANFFYSHSYALCYSEPLLITGMMGKYRVNDQLSILSGFHRGFYMFEDWNNSLNYQGGVLLSDSSEQTSLAYALDYGRNDPAEQSPQYVHSLVFKRQLSPKLLYVLQSDLGVTNNVAALGGGDAQWYGLDQYLLYTINQQWSAGMRGEWFCDADGTRVAGLGALGYRGWQGAGGYAGDFYEITAGLNYKPKPNIWLRPEVRWDWYDGAASPLGTYPLPFGDGNKDSQFTYATDLVVTF